jgi:hypothetical protein
MRRRLAECHSLTNKGKSVIAEIMLIEHRKTFLLRLFLVSKFQRESGCQNKSRGEQRFHT